jgi:hypothetical protein
LSYAASSVSAAETPSYIYIFVTTTISTVVVTIRKHSIVIYSGVQVGHGLDLDVHESHHHCLFTVKIDS